MKSGTAIVLLSGGFDSSLTLLIAREQHERVIALSFDYGQNHVRELDFAKQLVEHCNQTARWYELHKVEHRCVDLDAALNSLVTSGLLGAPLSTTGLAGARVPGRNALFVVLAHALAQEEKASALYIGANETDYSGFPDCRPRFISALAEALNVGYETTIEIHAPLVGKTKAEIFKLANELGHLEYLRHNSLSCYEGSTAVNPWGFGCGECLACAMRREGFEQLERKE